ncbi:MAG: acetate--CoA ligase family protein [Rhodobacteraceae bacterium]|nr:acetate--CoA ligase family protein [Paracoccaceae bacterium]
MKRDLSRLLNPRSVAVIGGGAWCASIIRAAQAIGFDGDIFPVHPSGKEIAGKVAIRRLDDWPGPIDAAFIGVNRVATIEVVQALNRLDAGGAVCFASGFSEAKAEDAGGDMLQDQLIGAAGDMPVLGPNCYGFVNALDRVAIWPDQHGMEPVESGVAILTQSSNIAINLTMQQRALPIAYMIACGNMAQTSQSDIALGLLDDARVTAIGLHIEGFADLRGWEALARKAHQRGVPLIALKSGISEQAQQATLSHTASLAGSDAGAQAFLDRLGIARVHGLPEFLETLKLVHCVGALGSARIASISCSGGEASLIADAAKARGLTFPALSDPQKDHLRDVLGPMVALANPLDYHTYIWRDAPAMARAWAGMTGDGIAMTLSIVDYPTSHIGDWACATQAALKTRAMTGAPFAVVSTLPELMPKSVAQELMQGGVVPMAGLNEALAAIAATAVSRQPTVEPVLLPRKAAAYFLVSEAKAKAALAGYGLVVPVNQQADSPETIAMKARALTAPLALKGTGLGHKSEHGAVRLNLQPDQVLAAAQNMDVQGFLVEEMVTGGVAELLIGVVQDPAHGFVLTLAAGGVLTELLQDSTSLLIPSDRGQIKQALNRLRCAPQLDGYRGQPGADNEAILDAIDAVQAYVLANADTVGEVEINPLICTPTQAVAVDALIRKADP